MLTIWASLKNAKLYLWFDSLEKQDELHQISVNDGMNALYLESQFLFFFFHFKSKLNK